ncbi:unnamed protein product [Prorocentrum cordatum]|uniref:Uncharacterized protein n=1 Tax=Prorocentrum cordatum TaxID=2364126 RepID=A0ABN9UWA9_9DINO|nr:unnamed protein product [Polarella glacialis]
MKLTMDRVGEPADGSEKRPDVLIEGTKVQLRAHIDKSDNTEIMTDIFIAWGRKVEKEVNLPPEAIAQAFDDLYREAQTLIGQDGHGRGHRVHQVDAGRDAARGGRSGSPAASAAGAPAAARGDAGARPAGDLLRPPGTGFPGNTARPGRADGSAAVHDGAGAADDGAAGRLARSAGGRRPAGGRRTAGGGPAAGGRRPAAAAAAGDAAAGRTGARGRARRRLRAGDAPAHGAGHARRRPRVRLHAGGAGGASRRRAAPDAGPSQPGALAEMPGQGESRKQFQILDPRTKKPIEARSPLVEPLRRAERKAMAIIDPGSGDVVRALDFSLPRGAGSFTITDPRSGAAIKA